MTKMAMTELVQRVTAMTTRDIPPKVIARELGYSVGYIRNVLWWLGVRKKSKKRALALEADFGPNNPRKMRPE